MKIDVRITNDEKQAHITVISGENETSKELTVEELIQSLSEKGVTKGIKKNTLEQICRNKLFNKKYLAAEAIPHQIGESAKLQIKIKPKERSTYDKGVDAEKKVDHYGIREGFITYVKKGDVIASRIPPTRGQNGFTVTGKKIEGILGKDITWSEYQGKNTKVIGNNLIVYTDGILKKEDTNFGIEQEIVLTQDLGIKTGSIILPLDAEVELTVHGDIKSGFTVQCRKITVMGSVEDAKITAKELEIGRGIGGTSDLPIIADYLVTGFIIGKRRIKSKFIQAKKEISGGSIIQADFVRSQVIQECSITAQYGVWTEYLFGSNKILVGVDIDEQVEYLSWSKQLESVNNSLKEIRLSNQTLLKKSDSVKNMAKRMPDNPQIQKELEKINELNDKINKIERIKEVLEKKLQHHSDNMYISGSPFILVSLGFTKKAMLKDKTKPHNDFTIKEFSYEKSKPMISGLYTLKGEEVIVERDYNLNEFNKLLNQYKESALG